MGTDARSGGGLLHRQRGLDVFEAVPGQAGHLGTLQSRSVELQPGFVVSLYGGNGRDKTRLTLRNDSPYLHFCCLLRDSSEATVRGRTLVPDIGEGYALFAPGEWFSAAYGPSYRHVDLMVDVKVLCDLAGPQAGPAETEAASGFLVHPLRAGERAVGAAMRLADHLKRDHIDRLSLYAAALDYLSVSFNGVWGDVSSECMSGRDRQCLLAARERLLRDLSRPPTIAALAREVGLNQLKLKQGFKTLFGTSVYALFQQHRMDRARDLLRSHNVTETALTLGYSNLSHFSTAYRKRFGVLPRHDRKGRLQ